MMAEMEKLSEELSEFRRLSERIERKGAVTACLLVLQGIAYISRPPDEG